MVGEMESKEKPKPTPDYLMQLMNDKKLMSSLPNFCGIFNHLERLLDEEISRVRKDMYNDTLNGSTEKRSSELPDAVGPIVQLQEKLFVPVKEYPDIDISVSIDLHQVLSVCVFQAEGEDSLKRMQLMELAILNGTYRDANIKSPALAFSFAANAQAPRIITGPAPMPQNSLRTPTPAGPTLMPLIRQIQTCMPNGSPHPGVMTQGPEAGLIYASPYDYPYTLAPATSILEYPIDSSGVLASSKAEELPLYLGFQTCHFPITVQRGEPSNRPPF
ncbi:KH domain-containing RNA-binding protein QKI [Salvelinus alpinus]